MSIRTITNSKFIRHSLQNRGYILPKNSGDVMKLIFGYFQEKKKETITKIKQLLELNTRLSITIDEWSSLRNRRYLNVLVHYENGEFFNLGLVYISKKCDSVEIHNLVETSLADFGIDFKTHIISVTTDGASVMKKFGREHYSEHLLCLNHGIHLAVIDVLYKKKEQTYETNTSEDEDDYEDEGDEEHHDDFDGNHITLFSPNIRDVILETRKIIKIFRKSPTNNIVLEQYVKSEFNMELNLLLDVKTRWNSLIIMIERFLKLQNCIKKSLIDLQLSDIWRDDNIPVLKNIFECLTPIKVAVEALSRKDATLLTSEVILNFLMKKINSLSTSLASEFHNALLKRIEERRDKMLISLMLYLQNPTSLKKENYFSLASKQSIYHTAENLLCRLFTKSSLEIAQEDEIVSSNDLEDYTKTDDSKEPTPLSIEDQLNLEINNICENYQSREISYKKTIKKEFQIF